MIDLHEVQTKLVFLITQQKPGSTVKFKLMDAADAVSKAIEAMDREARAPTPPLNGEAA